MRVDDKKRLNRRGTTGEVFTPKELVEEILEKLPLDSWDIEKTFCDPAAGNGNFLIEVYKWKVEKYNHSPLQALSTMYGCELMADNTAEMKFRLYKQAKEFLGDKFNSRKKLIEKILDTNIVCHDALTYNFKFDDLNFMSRTKDNKNFKDVSGKWYTVDEVVEKIKGGTAVRINSGAGVDVITEDKIHFLRSKKNDTKDDNISELPIEDIK